MTLPVATGAAGAVRLAYDLLGATLDTGSFPSHLWGVGQFSPSLWRQTVTLGLSNSASTSLDAARACCTSCKGLTGGRTSSGGLRPPLPAPQSRLEPRGLHRGPCSGGCRPQGRASLASLSSCPLSPSDPSPRKSEPQLGPHSPSARCLPSPV